MCVVFACCAILSAPFANLRTHLSILAHRCSPLLVAFTRLQQQPSTTLSHRESHIISRRRRNSPRTDRQGVPSRKNLRTYLPHSPLSCVRVRGVVLLHYRRRFPPHTPLNTKQRCSLFMYDEEVGHCRPVKASIFVWALIKRYNSCR